ncbi:MAG: hypothetical protein GH155_03825, partial [Spirochaeta sp.]|nr:hypothetical protein [Spirochaeta sp.]
GPLGAYLIHNKIMTAENDHFSFVGFQGEKIGRPGRVRVEVGIKEKKPVVVKIIGEATIVFKSQIEI